MSRFHLLYFILDWILRILNEPFRPDTESSFQHTPHCWADQNRIQMGQNTMEGQGTSNGTVEIPCTDENEADEIIIQVSKQGDPCLTVQALYTDDVTKRKQDDLSSGTFADPITHPAFFAGMPGNIYHTWYCWLQWFRRWTWSPLTWHRVLSHLWTNFKKKMECLSNTNLRFEKLFLSKILFFSRPVPSVPPTPCC